MSNRRHLTYMLLAGVVILIAMSALGVPLARALPYAVILACPLMMVFMMRGMDHNAHVDPQHDGRTPVASAVHLDDAAHPLDQATIVATDEHLREIDKEYRR